MLLLLTLGLGACGGDDVADPTASPTAFPTPSPFVTYTAAPTATATATPVPPEPLPIVPLHPAGTRTGIEGVDRFLDLREAGDVDGMLELVTFTPTPCTETEYGIPCPPGVEPGTLVPAWPWWGCHGAYSSQGTAAQAAEFITTYPGELHTVLRFLPTRRLDGFPTVAAIAVMFGTASPNSADGQFGWGAVLDEQGKVYGSVFACVLGVEDTSAHFFPRATILFAGPQE